MNAAAAHRPGRGGARGIGFLAPILALAAAVGGCSAAGVKVAADPVAAVRDAGVVSARIHSAKLATDVTMAIDGGSPQELRGLGVFDFDRRIGSMTVTARRKTTDEIVTPGGVYMRSSNGGTWRYADAARQRDGALFSIGYTSPLLDFALLRGVTRGAGTARYIGQGSVRGTAVAHYAGTLDLAASAEAAVGPVRTELLTAARYLADRTVPFDVYLDAHGRVRRIITRYAVADSSSRHDRLEVTAITDLYEFGSPVSVATPASAMPGTTVPLTPATTATPADPPPSNRGASPYVLLPPDEGWPNRAMAAATGGL